MAQGRLQEWLHSIAVHRQKSGLGHQVRLGWNPRTKEYGASCVGQACNKFFWLKEADVPDTWKSNLENGNYGKVEQFLNKLEVPDDGMADLYEVHAVMES